MKNRKAIIIGAGPAGLTAADEFLSKSDIKPIVIEKSNYMGGIARTVNYKGNRIDIGGHRFFSKSDRVMKWWLDKLPLQKLNSASNQSISYQQAKRTITTSGNGPDPSKEDKVMLLRQRKSRIYFARSFFDYPISLTMDTLSNLGITRTIRIIVSYLKSILTPIRQVHNLEQFYISRFGKELYRTFFKDYTEKVWGVPCSKISAEWGAQRTKGLSLTKAALHFLKQLLPVKSDIHQKSTETSLIERFLYPKFGPGQLWESVAKEALNRGAEIHTGFNVKTIHLKNNLVESIEAVNIETGESKTFSGDFFISTMPIKELINSFYEKVPENIREIANGLIYRDFITVGLLVKELKISNAHEAGKKLISDNWIYIQDPSVKLGRLQIFNNWSPYMVANPDTVWLGLEYFCNEGDELWSLTDEQLKKLAIEELASIGIIENSKVEDATVIRMSKTYPAYFGTYDRFPELRAYLDNIENLFLVGRNGMHKYNNQDHSMLTAMITVENIINGKKEKDNIWQVNTEMEYHEDGAFVSEES